MGGVLAALAVVAVLAVIGALVLPDLLPGGGNTTQNNAQQNQQANAGAANAGNENQDSRVNDAAAGDTPQPTTQNSGNSNQTPAPSGGGSGQEGQQSGGGSPEQAAEQTVRDFYQTAAGPDYQSSWDFLSSGYQQEFGARETLTNQFRTLERIQFTDGPRTTESNGDTATVAASTVAYHSDRTERLTGTASLVRAGDEWKISSLDFNQV
jgi:hypothetical protein